ncbi:MAG: CHASE2 domain-containing protein [Leptolyngbyaceae cyanobacterium]
MPATATDVFLAYSHKDEILREKLTKHLTGLQKQGIINSWDDRRLEPGTEKVAAVQQKMNTAGIILLLVSADFLSEQWDQQINLAMQRHAAGQAVVIPVILRDCDWHLAPFGHLVPLPRSGQAVTSWDDQDAAFAEIATGIRQAVQLEPSRHISSATFEQRSPTQFLQRIALQKLIRYGMTVAVPIILIRFLGLLQPAELAAYDQMMRLRLSAEPDDRLLIVEIDEDDRAKWADSPERLVRGDSSLPEPAIQQLLEKLEAQYAPAAIGLDIYRPAATDADFPSLQNQLEHNEDLFVICKVTDSRNPDSQDERINSPPPEVATARQGFSDFVSYDGSTVRLQLFHIPDDVMPDDSPCRAPFSLSLRLANHFLNASVVADNSKIQTNDMTLASLPAFAGGYQGTINASEHQVLLDYRAPQGDIRKIARRVSLTEVLEGALSQEDIANLQNRIVLIGVVDEIKGDLWCTPISDCEVPGLIIHAQMVSHLLRVLTGEQRMIWVWHWSIDWLWIGAWGIVGAAIGWHVELWQRVLIGGALATALLVALCIITFYGFQGWIPLVPAGLSLIMAIALAYGRKHFKSSKSQPSQVK